MPRLQLFLNLIFALMTNFTKFSKYFILTIGSIYIAAKKTKCLLKLEVLWQYWVYDSFCGNTVCMTGSVRRGVCKKGAKCEALWTTWAGGHSLTLNVMASVMRDAVRQSGLRKVSIGWLFLSEIWTSTSLLYIVSFCHREDDS